MCFPKAMLVFDQNIIILQEGFQSRANNNYVLVFFLAVVIGKLVSDQMLQLDLWF